MKTSDEIVDVQAILPANLHAQVAAEAKRRGITVAEAIRLAVQDYLKP